MVPERFCLGCGLRAAESFVSLATSERMKLFVAAHKLLMFILHDASAQTNDAEESASREALRPLVDNKDGHFLAAITSLVQCLLEGHTDYPISGVFGAGKTLSAAASGSVEGHWTYSWTDALVSQSLYVSLTWTAGILEICCSLRAKKKHSLRQP